MKMTIEQLEFPMDIKNKILKIKSITKLHTDFIAGKNIIINKTNVAIHEPHKIIISNNNQSIMLINYENDNSIYSNDLSNQVSLTDIAKLVLILSDKQ